MEWARDVGEGSWLRPRMTEKLGELSATVPTGFDTYLRVFHPVGIDWPEARLASDVEWRSDPTTWQAVADLFGTTMHPLAQFANLVGVAPPVGHVASPDGRDITPPEGGLMPVPSLAALTTVLNRHTTAPGDVIAGIWEGWGGLSQEAGRWTFMFWSDGKRHPFRGLPRAIRKANRRKYSMEPGTGLLPRDIVIGPKLELPGREYFLFRGPLSDYAHGTWPAIAPWLFDDEREPGPVPEVLGPQSPSLLWPADHAWLIASENDWDTTIVTCSRAAADEILAAPGLEVFEIPPDSDLTWSGDRINPEIQDPA